MTNFKEFSSRPVNGGIQYRVFFPNGYGCSIVRHGFSYGHEQGLWELAVITGDEKSFSLCYDTEITSDVLGFLFEEEVNDIVDKVEKLKNRNSLDLCIEENPLDRCNWD